MDNNELIAELRELAKWAKTNEWNVTYKVPDALDDAANALEALQRTDERWISVDEALPKAWTDVLVFRPSCEEEERTVDIDYLEGGNNFSEDYSWGTNVTHWRPLPAPPEIDKEGK